MAWTRHGAFPSRNARIDSRTPAVELVDATVAFNQGTVNEVVVLKDVNLRVPPGARVLVTGGNGSGKSTLLKAIAGTVPLSSGRVLLHGVDVTGWSPPRRARFLSFVHQDPLLGTCPNISVYDNLSLAQDRAWWKPFPRPFRLNAGQRALLDQSGLPLLDKAALPVANLSGGQRQFLALLITLSMARSLVLLDEFTAALDANVRSSIPELLRKIQDQTTIFAVLHQPEMIAKLSFTLKSSVRNQSIHIDQFTPMEISDGQR